MDSRADGVRARLIAEAVRVLDDSGPDALQARALTRALGVSTTAVYHYFGGMPALLRATADEGFRRLAMALGGVVESDDAVADICALALVYRRAALGRPYLYDLMFGLSAPGGARPEAAATFSAHDGPAREALSPLLAAVGRAMDQQRLRPGPAHEAAAQLWSMLHGYVGLELAGHFHGLDDPVLTVLVPLGSHLLIGLGDEPDAVAHSALDALATASHLTPSRDRPASPSAAERR